MLLHVVQWLFGPITCYVKKGCFVSVLIFCHWNDTSLCLGAGDDAW